MNRGDIWLAEVANKTRPVLILTRQAVIDVRHLVTVAEITTTIRGTSTEVAIDHAEAGLDRPSVINCDGIQTLRRSSLTRRIGEIGDPAMDDVCWAVSHALGC